MFQTCPKLLAVFLVSAVAPSAAAAAAAAAASYCSFLASRAAYGTAGGWLRAAALQQSGKQSLQAKIGRAADSNFSFKCMRLLLLRCAGEENLPC
jgi:hypothetical protein